MRDLARRAAAGRGTVAFVAGEAGAGKTRTLDELCRLLPRGTRSYRAACLSYAPAPLGPLADILTTIEDDAIVPAAAGLAAPTGDDAVDKRRLFERVAATLRAAAASHPIVAVIDDAHWADTVTLELLQFLIGSLDDARVLIVVAYRPEEITENDALGALVARAARARNVHRVELPPLSPAQIRELIGATLPKDVRIADESLREIRDRSEGNPLFAEEFLKAVVDDERYGEPRGLLPPSLRGLLLERLRRLAPDHVGLLEIGALIGRRFSAAFLARIAGCDLASLERFLRTALDEHFLIEDVAEPGWFSFRHALTRDAILERILAMRARAMHLVIAQQIEREPDRAGRVVELAEHYWRAQAFAECATHAELAGDLAKGRHAYAEAAALYERALACGSADERHLVALHEKASASYASLGVPEKVIEHLQVAIDHHAATGESAKLAAVYLEFALALRRAGRTAEELVVLRRAAELSTVLRNDELLLRSTIQLAYVHVTGEDWTAAEAELATAAGLLEHAGPVDEIRFRAFRGSVRLARNDVVGWETDLERAAAVARAYGDPRQLAFALTSYGVDARKLARFDLALALFGEAAGIGRPYGPLYATTFARLGYVNVLYLTGRLGKARDELLEVLADDHQSSTIRSLIAQFGVPLAVALRDDPLAERCISTDVLETAFATNEAIVYAPLAAALAERHLAEGEDDAAVALLERMLSSLPDGWSDCEALLPVAVCCANADVERARARLRAAPTASGRFDEAYRHLFEAYAAARFGSRDEKLRHAKSAAEMLRGLGMPLLEAESYELAEQSARAVALCETIGALRLPRRLGSRGKRRASATQLTPREREIVDVALRGLTNAAIAEELSLSERTVEAHLAAAYRKLGVRSRAELISVLKAAYPA